MDLNFREAAQGVLPYADQVAGEGGAGQVVANLISTFLSAALILAAILVLLYLIIGAFEWITSQGDSSKLQSARDRIMHAIIGLIVLSAVIAIFMLVQNLLGVTLINFSGISSGGGGGDEGTTTQYCPCGNDNYASIGSVGMWSYPDGPCYVCTSSGWEPAETTSCGVISCSPL